MSDEEDYNSEEDEDYVPSDGELGSEEENSGEEEDLSVLAADGEPVTQTTKRTRGKKSKKQAIAPRKRKGGIKLEGEETTDQDGDTENTELAQKLKEEAAQKKEENEKKRVDDLWASFMAGVQPLPKQAPSAGSSLATLTTKAPSVQATAVTEKSDSPSQKAGSDKITITKVFDFAGEEIKVTKEVDASSKEGKAELKKQQQLEDTPAEGSTTTTSTSRLATTTTTSSPTTSLTAVGNKRPAAGGGGLSGVLGKIGKKQKMGTLEKSKLDWDSFKKKEGIEEDLKIHNKGKDGYIERMAFLNRTDLRQFEIERDLRLSKSGKR